LNFGIDNFEPCGSVIWFVFLSVSDLLASPILYFFKLIDLIPKFVRHTYIYVFSVCLCIFIVIAGTLRLRRLRFFRAFSSVVRQMSGHNPQRRGTARTLPSCCVVLINEEINIYFFLNSANDQLDVQIFSTFITIFYMFRAISC
jgi:hypothetical protein